MAKKHHTPDEDLLNLVIGALEQENPRRYTAALNALLRRGPYVCHESTAEWAPLLRAELLAYLRGVVRDSAIGLESYTKLRIERPITFGTEITESRQRVTAEGEARDLVILQLQTLIDRVGLRHVQQCAASDCRKIFAKHHRRTYCSPTCQNRAYMRRVRFRDLNNEQRRKAARRRAH